MSTWYSGLKRSSVFVMVLVGFFVLSSQRNNVFAQNVTASREFSNINHLTYLYSAKAIVPLTKLSAASDTLFDNTNSSGSFFAPGLAGFPPPQEVLDWGIFPGGTVTHFQIGYSTDLTGTVDIDVIFYEGTNDSSDGTQVAQFSLPGLPGSSSGNPEGFLIDVDVSSASFFLPSGDFGYGYRIMDSNSGPIISDGGVGITDLFRLPPATDNFNFTGGLFAQFHMQVTGHAGAFPEVTIQEIQMVDPESLAVAIDASPLLGDTVSTVGVVYAPPGLSSSVPVGDAKMFIMDVAGGVEYSGINVITLGANGNLLAGFQVGDSVKVTGTVGEFGTQTQLVPIDAPELLGFTNPPQPVLIDPADLGGTTQDTVDFATAEKWETVLVRVENVTVVNDAFDSFSSWVVEDQNGNQILISADSDSLRTINDSRGTGNVDPSAAFVIPPVGTPLDAIVGYVDSRFGTNSINPRFPASDVVVGVGAPPLASDHNRDPVGPTSTQSVDVFVEITDSDGTVSGATLSYEVDSGGLVEMAMTPTTGDSFMATIPAQANGSLVTYFIKATDNDNNSTLLPTDAPDNDRFLYYVRDEGIRISDLQMNPFGDATGYFGLTVTVNGIAVSDSGDFGNNFILQQGSGAWNGIKVFTGSGNVNVGRGDSVSVTGKATEFRGDTEIGNIQSLTVISTGHPVPDATDVSTGDVNTGGSMSESFESVLIRLSNVEITDANPDAPSNFGEWVVDDGSGPLRVDDSGQYTFTTTDATSADFLPLGTTIASFTGVLDFTFSNFKLQPRNNDDFEGIVTDVEEFGPDGVPSTFALQQNYPNPFNPETTILYQLASTQKVQLRIYNVLGQLVRSLVDKQEPAGEHRVIWNGKNEKGISVPSGLYIYELKAGDFVGTKKMIFLK
ncbi:MAG: FlgD immunoglobulin-like domain containing protein [bacterium]